MQKARMIRTELSNWFDDKLLIMYSLSADQKKKE